MPYPEHIPPGLLSPGFEREPGALHVVKGPYGIQTRRTWTAADVEPKDLIDAMRSEYLWRASAFGENVQLSLQYGTQGTISLAGIRLPFEAFIPGQVSLTATKVDPAAPANITVTLTAATGGVPTVRSFIPAPAALPANGRLYTALTASTLTIAGVAGVAVAAGASIPLIAPSAVTAGSGILELTL